MSVEETMETTLFQQTWDTLHQGGWSAYEISNFAQSSPEPHSYDLFPKEKWENQPTTFACRHNRNYWSFGDYLGIGSGAHGKLSTTMNTDGTLQVQRSINPKATEAYMSTMETGGSALQTLHIPPTEAGREYLLMGLRHDEGVRHDLYQRLTGKDLVHCHAQTVTHLQEAGFLTVDSERLCLTPKGIPLADSIILALS